MNLIVQYLEVGEKQEFDLIQSPMRIFICFQIESVDPRYVHVPSIERLNTAGFKYRFVIIYVAK